MLDTLSVAEQLTAGGVARDQARVIARAIHDGVSQGGHVTTDQFEAGLAGVRAEIAGLEVKLTGEIAALDRKFTREIAGVQGEIAGVHGEIASVRGQIAGIEAQIAALETRLLRWVVGTLLAAAAVTVAILRFSL